MKLITTLTLAFVLAGCASVPAGVKMTAEEANACAAESCSVLTPGELRALVIDALRRGYIQGAQSGGRGL